MRHWIARRLPGRGADTWAAQAPGAPARLRPPDANTRVPAPPGEQQTRPRVARTRIAARPGEPPTRAPGRAARLLPIVTAGPPDRRMPRETRTRPPGRRTA